MKTLGIIKGFKRAAALFYHRHYLLKQDNIEELLLCGEDMKETKKMMFVTKMNIKILNLI